MADNKVVDIAAPPIIIIKKKKGHGGHHGGAWKVAYADFVTAMMALFIVLWLLNSNADVRKAIGGYFIDPKGVGKAIGSGMAGSGESLSVGMADMAKLKEKLTQAIKQAPELRKLQDQVDMVVTGDGLRIELLESAKGSFFESGKPQPTDAGQEMIQLLATELAKLPNKLMIEGHTDAKPYGNGDNGYGNWELSADRANAARQLMVSKGIRPDQVSQVRGFADQNLRKPKEPEDPSNRRVSVIVQYMSVPDRAEAAAKGEGKGEAKKEEKKPEAKAEGKPATKPETKPAGKPEKK
jgi:chemotaxis protein MotB